LNQNKLDIFLGPPAPPGLIMLHSINIIIQRTKIINMLYFTLLMLQTEPLNALRIFWWPCNGPSSWATNLQILMRLRGLDNASKISSTILGLPLLRA